MLCVYTTNHRLFLEYVLALHPGDETVWFFSNRRWASARRNIASEGSMPLLIREISDDDDLKPATCTYEAKLVSIKFAEDFSTDEARLAWVSPHLEIQRAAYTFDDPKMSLKVLDEHVAGELEGFMNADTIYGIRGLKRITPLLLTNLVKDDGGEPLSPDYKYSYALCRYPTSSS